MDPETFTDAFITSVLDNVNNDNLMARAPENARVPLVELRNLCEGLAQRLLAERKEFSERVADAESRSRVLESHLADERIARASLEEAYGQERAESDAFKHRCEKAEARCAELRGQIVKIEQLALLDAAEMGPLRHEVAELSSMRDKYNQLLSDYSEAQANHGLALAEIEELRRRLDLRSSDNLQLGRNLKAALEEVAALKAARAAGGNSDEAGLRTQLVSLTEATERLQAQITYLNAMCANRQTSIDLHRQALQQRDQEIGELREEVRELANQLTRKERDHGDLIREIRDRAEERKKLLERMEKLNARVEELTLDLNAKSHSLADASARLEEMASSETPLQEQLARLKVDLDTMIRDSRAQEKYREELQKQRDDALVLAEKCRTKAEHSVSLVETALELVFTAERRRRKKWRMSAKARRPVGVPAEDVAHAADSAPAEMPQVGVSLSGLAADLQRIRDVINASVNPFRKPGEGGRVWHFSQTAGRAFCGADEVGMATTSLPHHVTCSACLQLRGTRW